MLLLEHKVPRLLPERTYFKLAELNGLADVSTTGEGSEVTNILLAHVRSDATLSLSLKATGCLQPVRWSPRKGWRARRAVSLQRTCRMP